MSNPTEQPPKHRGAPGWFPPLEREWLFSQAGTDDFKNMCLDQEDVNEVRFRKLKDELREKFDAEFTPRMDAITASVKERKEAAEAAAKKRKKKQPVVPDPEIIALKKRYPYGYAPKLQQFWSNRKSKVIKHAGLVQNVKAPTQLQLSVPHSPRKVYHDSFRQGVSAAIGAKRTADGISRFKHMAMVNMALAEGYDNATDDVREHCEHVANEEREQMLREGGWIYQAQEHVQEYMGIVVNSLVGPKHGQVGNMWFHGVRVYRDKDETLKFFSVDTAYKSNHAVNGTFSRQPFYPEFFKRVQHLHLKTQLPANTAPTQVVASVLPTYDFEAVTPSQQQSTLLAHIEGHYTSTFHRDLPVPWDAIAARPSQYLIAPPTTFNFGDPTTMPYNDLPSAAKYFWDHPSFFKVPPVVPVEGEGGLDPSQPVSEGLRGGNMDTGGESVHPRKQKVNRHENAITRSSLEETSASERSVAPQGKGTQTSEVGGQSPSGTGSVPAQSKGTGSSTGSAPAQGKGIGSSKKVGWGGAKEKTVS
ncbi:hypothetical protein AAF712_014795 [Marasmius tenuissimus]|uniref:Uncharacterized protein n=1 Tax=Marasmius tenuissimus TaxID=585030 RepID=A0ABR2ZCK3_9AGAR